MNVRYVRCLECRRIVRTTWYSPVLDFHWTRGKPCPNTYEWEPAWRAWPRIVLEALLLSGALVAILCLSKGG